MAKSIAVHGADGKFQYYMPKAEAVGMVKDNLASWMSGSPAIEIKLGSITDPNYRGMSSKPKANLIHRYAEDRIADRNTATVTAVDAWEWQPITNVIVKDKRRVPSAYGALNQELRTVGQAYEELHGVSLKAFPVSEKEQVAIEAGLDRANQISKNAGWEMPFTGMRRLPHGSWGNRHRQDPGTKKR
jgi:hypothetical protein